MHQYYIQGFKYISASKYWIFSNWLNILKEKETVLLKSLTIKRFPKIIPNKSLCPHFI